MPESAPVSESPLTVTVLELPTALSAKLPAAVPVNETSSVPTTPEDRVNAALDELLAEHDPKTTPHVEFLGAQFDKGLAWVHFEEGHGGLGLSPKLQKVINERLAAVGAPMPYGRNPIGYGMGAPTIVTHGMRRML